MNLEPGATPFPESVIDMLMGGLGQPMGGWPKKLQKVVLGDKKPLTKRPGAGFETAGFGKNAPRNRNENRTQSYGRRSLRHLMYPEVFTEFARFARDYADVSVLPTPAFFYGFKPDEEISVNIEEGKTLIIKLINVGPVDKEGKRVVNFELNGMARSATIQDKSVKAEKPPRVQADPNDPLQVAAPIPGMITSLAVSVGGKVAKGDKLVTLEAMKMYTTINAPSDGVVDEIHAQVGDAVESKDLLVKLRA